MLGSQDWLLQWLLVGQVLFDAAWKSRGVTVHEANF